MSHSQAWCCHGGICGVEPSGLEEVHLRRTQTYASCEMRHALDSSELTTSGGSPAWPVSPIVTLCSLFRLLRLSAICASSKQSSPRIAYQADIANPTSPTNRYCNKKGATCGEGANWSFAFDKGKLVDEMYEHRRASLGTHPPSNTRDSNLATCASAPQKWGAMLLE